MTFKQFEEERFDNVAINAWKAAYFVVSEKMLNMEEFNHSEFIDLTEYEQYIEYIGQRMTMDNDLSGRNANSTRPLNFTQTGDETAKLTNNSISK